MARNGPPDDFNNQPTQFADYGAGGQPPAEGPPVSALAETPPDYESPLFVDPLDEAGPTPWYRKPAALAGWIVAVLVLIGLIVFGVLQLLEGEQGTSHTPSTSTAPSTTTTTTPPTTSSTAPSPSSSAPPTSSAVEPPAQQPGQQPTRQQPTQQPTHRHHMPQLPSVITIPEVPTVITLPPGLP